MPQIHGECGLEIHREGSEVALLDRRTWRLGDGTGAFAPVGVPL